MNERKYKDTSQPVATGVGAAVGGVAGGVAGGAAAGAAVGGLTGPVGAALGAVAGAAVGAMVGKAIDPKAEDAYWRQNYIDRPYVGGTRSYDDYGPAYKYGVDNYSRYKGHSFDEVEGDLRRDWSAARGRSSLEWDDARHATRDAWNRLANTVERAVPGDSDGDGR